MTEEDFSAAPPQAPQSAAAPAAENEVVIDGGPGLAFMPFVVMEDLLDKLKLLNYEEVKIIFGYEN